MDSVRTIISLEGLDFYAYHGVYEQERTSGNHFTVDLKVSSDTALSGLSDQLQETIDYEALYNIVAEEMQTPSYLLETIAHRIAEKCMHGFTSIAEAEVSVSKHNPPIKGKCQRSRVTVIRTR